MIKIVSPIKLSYWDSGGKLKSFSLNLNVYRNAHYFTLNQMKKLYKDRMREQIEQLPVLGQISIQYIVFLGSKRRTDISNICSIVDKFFCDALVEFGKLPDDSYSNLPKIEYCYGGIDTKNPRVEINLIPFEDSHEERNQIELPASNENG